MSAFGKRNVALLCETKLQGDGMCVLRSVSQLQGWGHSLQDEEQGDLECGDRGLEVRSQASDDLRT